MVLVGGFIVFIGICIVAQAQKRDLTTVQQPITQQPRPQETPQQIQERPSIEMSTVNHRFCPHCGAHATSTFCSECGSEID
ncbi:MAG: hypothetical protein ACFFAN_06450 [Promethearchaeota archaeon]